MHTEKRQKLILPSDDEIARRLAGAWRKGQDVEELKAIVAEACERAGIMLECED